jgi:hypothetical protein
MFADVVKRILLRMKVTRATSPVASRMNDDGSGTAAAVQSTDTVLEMKTTEGLDKSVRIPSTTSVPGVPSFE